MLRVGGRRLQPDPQGPGQHHPLRNRGYYLTKSNPSKSTILSEIEVIITKSKPLNKPFFRKQRLLLQNQNPDKIIINMSWMCKMYPFPFVRNFLVLEHIHRVGNTNENQLEAIT